MPALFPRLLSLLSLALPLAMMAPVNAHAELVLRLLSPHAAPGASVELEGLLLNDTGNPLSAPIPSTLNGQWQDAQGLSYPAHFRLRTSPDAADLPINTYTRTLWTGTVPAQAQGLLTLSIQGADDTLLALQTGAGPLVAQAGNMAGAPHDSLASSGGPAPSPLTQQAGTTSDTPTTTASLSPFETFRNALSPYEPVYFAFGSNGGANARFQLSFKYRPFSPSDPANPDFMDNWYIGYTQTSVWDLHSDSVPFVDTSYNPSLFWARESLWEIIDWCWVLGLNAGIEHKSNGKDGDESRSLNDVYLQPKVSYRFNNGSRLVFMPRLKSYFDTDANMRYPAYLGYVDWKLRWAQDNGMTLSGMYRQGSAGHATQIEATWPLRRSFLHMNGHLYAQYFQGHGETLLGYQHKSSPQFRIGIALVP